MNLMSKWVKMINEGTYNFPEENDDVSRTETGELGADDHEEQQSLLDDIKKANEKYEKSKTIREAEEGEEDVPDLTDDEKKNLEYPKEGDHEKEYWDRVQKQIEKIKDGAVRLMVVKTARDVLDNANKNPNTDKDDRELESKMSKIIDDINNGSEDDASVEKSVKEFEDLLKYNFTTDLGKTGTRENDVRGIEGIEDDPEYQRLHDELSKARKSGNKKEIEKRSNKIGDYVNSKIENATSKKFYIVNYVANVVRKNDDGGYTVEMDSHGDRKFETEEQAAEFVSKGMSQIANRYHIKPEQFLNLKDTYETAKKSSDVYKNAKSSIPSNINRVDPDAFGFIYPNPKDIPEDDTRNFHIEFIIYHASNVAPYPSQSEEDKERKQRIEAHAKYIKDLDQEIQQSEREHYSEVITKGMTKLLGDGKEQELLKILKDFISKYLKEDKFKKYQNMTDDDILNLTGDDFNDDENIKLTKLKVLASKIEYATLKKVDNPDDEDEDEDDEEFDPSKAKDTKLSTDDEILAAYNDEQELNRMKKDMEKSGSIDGYDTRSDLTQAEKDDLKDAKKREEEEERETKASEKASERENDSDDYEGSQNDTKATTSREMKGSGNTKSSSKLKLHEVPVTKKFMDYLNTKPKSEWPKNADEVKKMKKKMEEEWAE